MAGRSIVLVGLMGAGKTSIGRRLAARLGMPFRDADTEIELAAGCTIPELFSRYGEKAFRDGERRVIRRLLAGDPLVLAFGGGAFIDADTRAVARDEAVSIWLRCPLPTLVRRVSLRDNRPLLADGDPADILERLIVQRYPIYAEADVIVDCGDESPDVTTTQVLNALLAWRPPRRLTVALPSTTYDVVIGDGLLRRAGALLAPRLPQKRAMVVTDESVAGLHLATLLDGSGGNRHSRRADRRAGGRGIEEPGVLPGRGGPAAGGPGGTPHRGHRAGRRRGRRPGRFRRGDHAARAALRADPHHAAVAGGQFGRRQDRGEHAARQEPGGRVPPAAHGAGGHRHPGHAADARTARGLRGDRQGRPDRRPGVLPLVRAARRRRGRRRPRKRRPRRSSAPAPSRRRWWATTSGRKSRTTAARC